MKIKSFFIYLISVSVIGACAQTTKKRNINNKQSIIVTKTINDSTPDLSSWYGIYVNSDYDGVNNYDSALSYGDWFRLKIISKDSIVYDSSPEMLYPTKAPTGEYINMNCSYKIKNDTLFLYDKKKIYNFKEYGYKNVYDIPPSLILFTTVKGKYFGYSIYIDETIKMPNTIRALNDKAPYLFGKFDLNEKPVTP